MLGVVGTLAVMCRLARAVVVTLACVMAIPAVAGAETRTGSHGKAYPNEGIPGSPTHPRLDHFTIRYDSTAGSLIAQMSFAAPLADPKQTSALRPYRYEVTVGDYFSSICLGDDDTWLKITGELGDDAQAVLVRQLDLFSKRPGVPVSEQLNSTRQILTLQVTDTSLVGLNLICADASIEKRDDTRFAYSSGTFGFLLDGFSRLDGELAREAPKDLAREAELLDHALGNSRGYVPNLRTQPRCRRRFRDTVACTLRTRLTRAPGRPTLRLRGEMTFPRPYRGNLTPRWAYDMSGSLRWQHCPRRFSRKFAGRPCRLPIRWRGTKKLTSAALR